MTRLSFRDFDVLTFDCYGTLIDWERGLLSALRPVFERRGISASDDALLETFARYEAQLESGEYRRYHDVLAGSFRGIGHTFGFTPTDDEIESFPRSLGDWPAFPDSPPALARLHDHFNLAVITNCDDDLFALSNLRLGVTFDWIVTAEKARSYKPSRRNFELAFATIGIPRERILHVAQSLYHDHVPAKQLGLSTVWINRHRDKTGWGATLPVSATPDLTVPDLKTFAAITLGS